MNILKNARTYRKAIELAVPSLDDKTASTSADLFPKLKEDGSLVKAGTRINWSGKLKRAAITLLPFGRISLTVKVIELFPRP